MENKIYKELWEEFLKDESNELEQALPDEDEDEYVKIKSAALHRLLLDYSNYLSSIDEAGGMSQKDKLRTMCSKIGLKSFSDWLRMNNLINQSEKGKLGDKKK